MWLIAVFLLHPTPLVGLLMLPICVCTALVGGNVFLKVLGARRISSFVNQLEMVLRMMAGALRVGLGLRQSMILVAEEMPRSRAPASLPAHYRPYQHPGMSINDSLDELARSLLPLRRSS